MNEEIEWAVIAAGKYEINRNGDVRSVARKDSMGRNQGGFILKNVVGTTGYYRVALRINKKQVPYSVHRLLAQAFIPNPDNKPCINHINSNRLDNSLDNLEWVTYSENNSHAHKLGGQSKYYGEKHHRSKLNWDKVNEIRNKYKNGLSSVVQMSKDYSICLYAIRSLLKNKTWKNEYQ